MQSIQISRLAVLAVLAVAPVALPQSSAPPKAKTAPANEILAALKTGRPVVVVVQPTAKARTGEAYADWAEYLNDFAAREKSVQIVRLSQRRYSEIVTAPKLSRPYNTLFLRDAKNALLYRGMILEPDVYRVGMAYMTAKPGADIVQREGLEKVKLDTRL